MCAIDKDRLVAKDEYIDIPKFTPEKFAPRVLEFVDNIKRGQNPLLHNLLDHSIMTPRSPIADQSEKQIFLPTTESIREQIHNKCYDKNGKFSESKYKTWMERANKFGRIFYADGVKLQTVSNGGGSNAGDAYIAANLEILLRTAKDLDCEIVFGIYSGDENAGILVPKGDLELTDEQIQATLKTVADNYFRNPSSETSKFFAPLQKLIDKEYPNKGLQMGLKIHTQSLKNAKIHRSKKQTVRDRGIAAAIIDGSLGNHVNAAAIPLAEAMFDTFHGVRKSDKQHAMIPHHLLTESNRNEYLQVLEIALEEDNYNLQAQAIALAELSMDEPLYPRELKIRKIANLESSVQRAHTEGKTTYFLRIADMTLKETNEYSHTLGDYNLIATARTTQEFFKAGGIDPHKNIEYFQSYGSFILTTTDHEIYQQMVGLVNNPFELNKKLYEQEQARKITQKDHPDAYKPDTESRAKPFIVASPFYLIESKQPVPFKIAADADPADISKKLWQFIELSREQQSYNETLTALILSGLANVLPEHYSQLVNHILRASELIKLPQIGKGKN